MFDIPFGLYTTVMFIKFYNNPVINVLINLHIPFLMTEITYIPTNSVWEFSFVYILTNIY